MSTLFIKVLALLCLSCAAFAGDEWVPVTPEAGICARQISTGRNENFWAVGCERKTALGYPVLQLFDGRWIHENKGVGEVVSAPGYLSAITVTTDGRAFSFLPTLGWGKLALDGCIRQTAQFDRSVVALTCANAPDGGQGIVVHKRVQSYCNDTGCFETDYGRKAIAGSAKWIAVDQGGEHLWIVTADGKIKRAPLKGKCEDKAGVCIVAWEDIPGCATRVAIGDSNTHEIWALGCRGDTKTGYEIARWRNGVWSTVGGKATDIAVGKGGVYTIQAQGQIHVYVGP